MTTPTATPILHAPELIARLRVRYAAPGFAFFTEVGDDPQRSRSADGLAVAMWRSRGLEILGFEVKVSRTDWLKELKSPAKADRIGRYCDRWYLVVGDAAIVKPGELPPAWGLLIPKGNGLHEKVRAPKMAARLEMSRPLLAAICRAIHKVDPSTVEMHKEYVRGRHEMAEQLRSQHESDLKSRTYSLNQQVDDLKATIADFEKASGVRIGTRYQCGLIGEAVRIVLAAQGANAAHAGFDATIDHLRRDAAHLSRLVEAVERAAASAHLTKPVAPAASPQDSAAPLDGLGHGESPHEDTRSFTGAAEVSGPAEVPS